jgi:hypothetical protein
MDEEVIFWPAAPLCIENPEGKRAARGEITPSPGATARLCARTRGVDAGGEVALQLAEAGLAVRQHAARVGAEGADEGPRGADRVRAQPAGEHELHGHHLGETGGKYLIIRSLIQPSIQSSACNKRR